MTEPTTWDKLTEEQLKVLPIKRLLNVLKLARKSMNTSGRCGCCGEPWSYIHGPDSSEALRAKEAETFYDMVKAICDTREHSDK